MISVCASVPRSTLATKPSRFEFSADEARNEDSFCSQVVALAAANGELDEEKEGVEESKHDARHIPGFPAALQLSDDDDSDDDIVGGVNLKDEDDMRDDEEGDSDGEDDELKASDSVFLTANTDDDYSSIEMHVYDEETNNLYVHHDFSLPAFPLALEWLRLMDGETLQGSYVAVGSFQPGIEIWNLDVLDVLEPTCTLGGYGKAAATGPAPPKKKGKKKRPPAAAALKAGSHGDAVMDLSWNRVRGDCLASGSADSTVKIWDLRTQEAAQTWTYHKGKVQGVAWHPVEAAALATGAHDRTVAVRDARTNGSQGATMPISADLEALAWDPHDAALLVAATEDGVVVCYDIRNPATPAWRVQAHPKAATSLAFSKGTPGLMATASTDTTVRLWNTQTLSSGSVKPPLAEKAMTVGQIFSVCFDETSPFLLAAGGSKGILALWDTTEAPAVASAFQQAPPRPPTTEEEYLAAAAS